MVILTLIEGNLLLEGSIPSFLPCQRYGTECKRYWILYTLGIGYIPLVPFFILYLVVHIKVSIVIFLMKILLLILHILLWF